jgi:hypothetical protein
LFSKLGVLYLMKNCHDSRESLVQWSIHMPPVRTCVAIVYLFLAVWMLMEESMVLE